MVRHVLKETWFYWALSAAALLAALLYAPQDGQVVGSLVFLALLVSGAMSLIAATNYDMQTTLGVLRQSEEEAANAEGEDESEEWLAKELCPGCDEFSSRREWEDTSTPKAGHVVCPICGLVVPRPAKWAQVRREARCG